MKNKPAYQLIFSFGIWLGFLITAAGCSPQAGASTSTTLPSLTPTVPCEQTVILPQITEIQPTQPLPGNEVTVIGSGGYIQDTCGGYIEGAREFMLFLDSEIVGNFSCYVNRCEASIVLPDNIAIGPHCLAAEEFTASKPDGCPYEFQVVSR